MALLRAALAAGERALLRRAVSSVAGARRVPSNAFLCSPPSPASAIPAAARRLSSAAASARSSADSELLRVIGEEIKWADECEDTNPVVKVPENFPFKIDDVGGSDIITLTREYEGEQIDVVVRMPSVVDQEEPEDGGEDNEDSQKDDDEDDEEGKGSSQMSLGMIVTVSKGSRASLEFACTAYPDELIIDSLSVKNVNSKDEDDGEVYYEGPDFNDLDENLQKAFHKYLEKRGFTAETTNFLHQYMVHKDSREYRLWLSKLKEFISL